MRTLLFALLVSLLSSTNLLAVPYLQLDADPSHYVAGDEESIVADQAQFTLFALINSTDSDAPADISSETYYISMAVTPSVAPTDPLPDLGSFVFDGTEYQVVGDMTYGTPPLDDYLIKKGLSPHGIFPTYYTEISFQLDPTLNAALYNSQDNPGGPTEPTSGSLYYADFDVDVSGLDDIPFNYEIHFDLYTKAADGSIASFAPFSHDAVSGGPDTPPTGSAVPEPATMALFGLGLIIFAGIGRRKIL